jgi:hypothetical protein
MDKLSQVVKAFNVQSGAQIVGIASAEVMNQFALDNQKPEQNLPGAKTVISFGIRMLDSIFKTPNIRTSRFSYMYLHDQLDKIAWKVATHWLGFWMIAIKRREKSLSSTGLSAKST